MRHLKLTRHFSRTRSHYWLMFRNMTVSLLRQALIKTTLEKAKELRRFVEPIITLAKQDTLHHRQLASSFLLSDKDKGRSKGKNEDILHKLFTEIGPFYQDRPGGYLRILKCGFRKGDAAAMAMVELVGHEAEIEAEE